MSMGATSNQGWALEFRDPGQKLKNLTQNIAKFLTFHVYNYGLEKVSPVFIHVISKKSPLYFAHAIQKL